MKKNNLWKLCSYILGVITGIIIGISISCIIFKNIIESENKFINKILKYYKILNDWLLKKQKKKDIYTFFEKNNYKTIAIYGMKELGERLLDEIENTNIKVKYIIDKNDIEIKKDIPLYKPSDSLPEVDVIIVTASFYYTEISNIMKNKLKCDIASIEDVIYSQY